jgi:DNA-binding response OmpR family regulator
MSKKIPSVRTILIIDDDLDVLKLLQKPFGKQGYTVVTAQNGQEGFEKAMNHLPDVILSDILMPGMSGYELCKALKHHPSTSAIPVILLTALGDTNSTVKGFEAGADEYISKPFEVREVLERVERVLRWVIHTQQDAAEVEKAQVTVPHSGAGLAPQKKDALKKILDEFQADVEAVDSVVITDEAGNILGAASSDVTRQRVPALGTLIAKTLQFSERISQELDLGTLDEIMMLSETELLLVYPLEYVGAMGVTTLKSNQGMIRWYCREAIDKTMEVFMSK